MESTQGMADGLEGDRPVPHPYYEQYNKGHDDLLRCDDCKRLVTYTTLFAAGRTGTTPCCGTRKVREVRALKFWEWIRVRTGLIRFDHRIEFLKEFETPPGLGWLRVR